MRKINEDFLNQSIFDTLNLGFLSEQNVDFTVLREGFSLAPLAVTYPAVEYGAPVFSAVTPQASSNDSALMPWLGKVQYADPVNVFASAEFIPSDPLLGSQLHLINANAGQLDINVETAWDDYTGSGIQINIFDNGFDYVHADIAAHYLSGIDYDYTSNDFDPVATGSDNHGTAVMGIVGAVGNNGEGGVGVAFDASLVGYRGFALSASNSEDQILDAAGLGDGIGNTNGGGFGSDVISVSGGFGSNVFFPSSTMDDPVNALEVISEMGRSGLGTIYVKSSGNSRAAADSSSREEGTAERFDSTKFSINVAALRMDGWVTDYSTPGANVLVAAFADNLANNGTIFTTDRTGTSGYTTGDYTGGFSGTSAAAPQVAGVVALMLEANADLGWRDVQQILAASAVHVGSNVGSAANMGGPGGGAFEQSTQIDGSSWFWNAADNWNGGGMHFSNDYGYGLVDATAAVRLAESWQAQSTSANDVSTFEDDFNTTVVITDGDVAGLDFIINETTSILMEHVELALNFSTTYLADMEVYLTSPEGTRVQLIADTGDSGDFDGVWRFGTTAFMGENSAGDWTLTIVDDASGDTLTVFDADLRTSGSSISSDDTYIFTNEFSDYAGVAGHVVAFVDSDGGTDWINASAVSSNSTINFAAGTGTIDGVAITVGNIENIYTGDGNDILTGSTGTNILYGGRGNDRLDGGAGDDDLFGGDGADTFLGGAGADDMDGGDGFDSVDYRGASSRVVLNLDTGGTLGDAAGDSYTSIERVYGSDFNDSITGTDANEFFYGEDGNDTINAGGGLDRLYGGDGNDIQRGDAGNDQLYGSAGSDQLNGGTGFDIANYRDATSAVSLNLGSGGTLGDAAGDTYFGIEAVYGSDFDDILAGNNSANELRGWDGDDILNGAGGSDRLFGGAGADALNGGTGTDIAVYTDASSAVTVNLATVGTVGDAAGDTYSSIEWVWGSDFNDIITGDAGNNRLEGRDGNDTLNGGDGNDRLIGGEGDDTINGGNGVDTIFGQNGNDNLIGAGGNDFFFGSDGGDSINGGLDFDTVSYLASTAGVDVNLLSGGTGGDAAGDSYASVERVFGSQFVDTIIGDNGANTLLGNGGGDYLNGGLGNDSLFGGAGTDSYGYDTTNGDADVVNGFSTTGELIYILGGDTDFDTWAEIQAVGTDAGANAIFNFGGGNTLTIVGQNLSDLDAADFDFGGVPPAAELLDDPDAYASQPLTFDEIVAFHQEFVSNVDAAQVQDALL